MCCVVNEFSLARVTHMVADPSLLFGGQCEYFRTQQFPQCFFRRRLR
jgi:hypothetical protein